MLGTWTQLISMARLIMMYHDVYVAFPDGYRKPGKVGKLNKALYGLPEAAWVWCENLEVNLKGLGIRPLGSNTGVFIMNPKQASQQ